MDIFGVGKSKRAAETDGKEGPKAKKLSPGELRIQKDLEELDGGKIATFIFPDPNVLTFFQVEVAPTAGYWKGAKYTFNFSVPNMYPHEAPKVECMTKIYHPNIDLTGKVCLNILRHDWKPVLDVNAVIYGLILLFEEPNPDDPLEKEIAELFRNDLPTFRRNVEQSLRGSPVVVNGKRETFPKLI